MAEERGDCPSCRATNVVLKEVAGLKICDKCSSKKFSSKVRKAIEDAYQKQEEQKRKLAWKHRVDVAKKGVRSFDHGKILEALKSFRDYLAILETRHSVEPDGLHPGLFDPEKDTAEILLIAGIYWDMAKIYDHIKGHKLQTRQSLNKFVEFSVNRKHLIVASEAVRKYIKSGMAVNDKDFKEAHNYLRANLARCFIAGAIYGPDSYEVVRLQNFRDNVLQNSLIGRILVQFYYFVSPYIAKLCVKNKILTQFFKSIIDWLLKRMSSEKI